MLEKLQLSIFFRLSDERITRRMAMRSDGDRAKWITMKRMSAGLGIIYTVMASLTAKVVSLSCFAVGSVAMGYLCAAVAAGMAVAALCCAVALWSVMDPRPALRRAADIGINLPRAKL